MPGHKGLLGPQGTGVLYIRPGLILTPIKQGGTGTSSQLLFQPDELPERAPRPPRPPLAPEDSRS